MCRIVGSDDPAHLVDGSFLRIFFESPRQFDHLVFINFCSVRIQAHPVHIFVGLVCDVRASAVNIQDFYINSQVFSEFANINITLRIGRNLPFSCLDPLDRDSDPWISRLCRSVFHSVRSPVWNLILDDELIEVALMHSSLIDQ